ncbi:ABC transporter substrate-binding protein [Candidatus Poriferisodalis sp.]|uniref:ABC transporter substrate-binding protein n=1 Tax=Candidatus Poriferisodalis sp. TaxID=3101277 RepID=UPI003B02607E
MLFAACGTGGDAAGDDSLAPDGAETTAATAPSSEDASSGGEGSQQGSTESTTETVPSKDQLAAPGEEAPVLGGGGTLSFGVVGAPPSLNPGIGDPAFGALYQWAYDSLVIMQPDGSFAPNLAVEFGYTDDQNMRYELTLREGVKFSDGTDLDAGALKTYLEYVRSQPTALAQALASVTDIEITGPRSVALVLSTPDPGMSFFFAQGSGVGNVISSAALETPETLDLGTAGAGPYMLVSEESTPNDTYTFVPNPHYWNPARIHWDEVIVRVIPNSSSIIEAIRAGQLQAAQGDATTMSAAAEGGITVIGAPMSIVGINLVDRDGVVSGPLGDVRVRRALNHAVDREAVAAALLGDSRFALSQYALSGQPGHDPALDALNAYDPDRARALLTEAGYGDGITIGVLDASIIGLDILTQAVAGQLAEVGVTLDRTTVADPTAYFTGLVSAQYPAVAMFYGVSNMQTYQSFFINPAGPFNPFGTVDPELDALYAEYFATVGDTSDVERRINARLVDQAWVLPVMGSPLPWYLAEGLTGIEATSANSSIPTLADIRPE